MDPRDMAFSIDLILENILSNLSVSDLKNAAQVNIKWNQPASTFLREKSILNLKQASHIKEHLDMIQKDEEDTERIEIHPRIHFNLSSQQDLNGVSELKQADFMKWIGFVGGNVRKASIELDLSERFFTLEQYIEIFSKLVNVEDLSVDLTHPRDHQKYGILHNYGDVEIIELPAPRINFYAFLEPICFESLKVLKFNEMQIFKKNQAWWTRMNMDEVFRFLVKFFTDAAPNLEVLKDRNGYLISKLLAELKKTNNGGERLGKIKQIESMPDPTTPIPQDLHLLNTLENDSMHSFSFKALTNVCFFVDTLSASYVSDILNSTILKNNLTHLKLMFDDATLPEDFESEPPDIYDEFLCSYMSLRNMKRLEFLSIEFQHLFGFGLEDHNAYCFMMFPKFDYDDADDTFYPALKEMKIKIKTPDKIQHLVADLFPYYDEEIDDFQRFPNMKRFVINEDWEVMRAKDFELCDTLHALFPNAEFETEELS